MDDAEILGPFVGYTDHSTAKIWMRHVGLSEVHVSIHPPPGPPSEGSREVSWAEPVQIKPLAFKEDRLFTGVAEFDTLNEDSLYYYKVWKDPHCREPLRFNELDEMDLHFRTLPNEGPIDRLDFLLMSCHNPTKGKADGEVGFKVWKHIPEILRHNEKVRFAILGGDQIYADDIAPQVLKSKDEKARIAKYVEAYKAYWNNVHYRRVLCSLPSVMMWDDHDIIDGWGTVDASYEKCLEGKQFKAKWKALKDAATVAFRHMQASRNPKPLSEGFKDGHDACFRVGRAGFILADLRHNRDKERDAKLGRLWTPTQFKSVKTWVENERSNLDTLFFLTPVTFAHGDPKIEEKILDTWKYFLWVSTFCKWLSRIGLALGSPLIGSILGYCAKKFDDNVGDLRDDVNDGWGAPVNATDTHNVLSWLFGLQNPPSGAHPLSVVILSGDIHTSGYSTLYSQSPDHTGSPVIHHVVASPVAYSPFPWFGEALFRSKTKHVTLGKPDATGKFIFGAQVSHHYCHRNVAIISLRRVGCEEKYLKVKFYLEDWPEPQIMVFDLDLQRTSHLENISWREKNAPITFSGHLKKWSFRLMLLFLVGYVLWVGGRGLWRSLLS